MVFLPGGNCCLSKEARVPALSLIISWALRVQAIAWIFWIVFQGSMQAHVVRRYGPWSDSMFYLSCVLLVVCLLQARDVKHNGKAVCLKKFMFASNSGYSFVVNKHSYHSVDTVTKSSGVRQTILVNWYDQMLASSKPYNKVKYRWDPAGCAPGGHRAWYEPCGLTAVCKCRFGKWWFIDQRGEVCLKLSFKIRSIEPCSLEGSAGMCEHYRLCILGLRLWVRFRTLLGLTTSKWRKPREGVSGRSWE